ncbi:group-specific protein [Psychrobacillus sp. FSL H8-0484]|uniref:group-specific protein n=1 Tax=Psychrobacillus sp. FSL H8-0484 TaxID=2921390 RepID=UPI0030F6ABCF
MDYVYHMVPNKMMNDKLISLNSLKEMDEELYQAYAKKYRTHPDREKLLERRIPKLDCLWNDVIFFLPLHPHHVYRALKTVGVNIKTNILFYKIPTKNLMNNKNAVYLYLKENDKGPSAEIDSNDIKFIDIESFNELTHIPNDTVTYFEEEHKNGNNFGMFVYIPHILSLGEVSILDAKIINWSEESGNS